MAPPKYPQLWDPEWLTQRFVTERRSTKEIAAELGCVPRAVRDGLQRFDIALRTRAEDQLSHDELDAWKAKGGAMACQPIGPAEHKCAASELGLASVKDLQVLSANKDPFYCGTPVQIDDGEWFGALWEEHGAVGHLRRLHYRLVSGEERMTFYDGGPYVNNLDCFNRLCRAGAFARHLDLVGLEPFVDRRNPDPIINVSPREFEPEPYVEMSELDWHAALPWLPGVNMLNVADFEIPEPIVTGYDYDPSDQELEEIWVEKTTVNDVLGPVCESESVNLVPSAGQQSITNAHKLLQRAREHGKPAHVGYISDYDEAGDNMPVAVARKLEFYRQRFFPDVEVTLEPIALTREQVEELGLPRMPGKSKNPSEKFEEGVVELDALEALHPGLLARLVREWIAKYRDPDLSEELTSVASTAHVVTLRKPGSRRLQNCALSWAN